MYGLDILIWLGGGRASCWGDHSLARYSIYLSAIVFQLLAHTYLPTYLYLSFYLSIYLSTYLPNLTIPSFRNTQSPPDFSPLFFWHARTPGSVDF